MALPSRKFLIVDRDTKWVTLYKRRLLSNRWRLVQRFRCAIGAQGYETPRGMFSIDRKALDPDWLVPDSDWVRPDMRGKIIPAGDPANPILGAFLHFWEGSGLHGTADLDSLGTAASHGCVRLREEHARYLHKVIPEGTPIYVF